MYAGPQLGEGSEATEQKSGIDSGHSGKLFLYQGMGGATSTYKENRFIERNVLRRVRRWYNLQT